MVSTGGIPTVARPMISALGPVDEGAPEKAQREGLDVANDAAE